MSASFVNNCAKEKMDSVLHLSLCHLLKQVVCCSKINFIIIFTFIQGRYIGMIV